ncbi:DNA-3-methyladenine glycosylase family protein [Uliginosibacterium gangwonense]|uniref:DNA-3-methyladenine glycosylase family protein n=1 Tax=Uliginosibacterium gangwonense TaxID=392736 RepID=UPI000368BE8B|nr:AlkA N-terminal domain-containing protein [Uliginosibacterium gangwonense]
MLNKYSFTLPLPPGFRPNDILAFHRRDPHGIAETVDGLLLVKGMLWREAPASLSLRFSSKQVQAHLAVDRLAQENDQLALDRMVRRMLGLTQDIETFEKHYADHPQLGKLIKQQPGLRVPVAATPFEALTWAITGQQISVSAAVSLRRKLILAANLRHSGGLLCYPGAQQIVEMPEEILRQAGFSSTKAKTLQTISRQVLDGRLPLDAWAQAFPEAEIIREQLLGIRGIGPWTINYTLLRGFGWLDGSLHGDAAVRRGLQTLLGTPNKVGEKETEAWLAQFSPWRALIGAHIWAMQASTAY